MRIYVVTNEKTGERDLVRAGTQAQAIRAVTNETYSCALPTHDQLVDAVRSGAEILDTEPAKG